MGQLIPFFQLVLKLGSQFSFLGSSLFPIGTITNQQATSNHEVQRNLVDVVRYRGNTPGPFLFRKLRHDLAKRANTKQSTNRL